MPIQKYKVLLKEVVSGEIRCTDLEFEKTSDTLDVTDKEAIQYLWAEGNNRCDCVRFKHFYNISSFDIRCSNYKFELVDIVFY